MPLGVIDGVEDLREVDLGVFLLELLHLLPRGIIGRDLRRALGPLDLERDDLLSIHLGDRALLGRGVLDLAEIRQPDEATTGQSDLGLRQLIGILGIADHAHRLLRAGDLRPPAGRVEVALPQLLIDLSGGDPLRLEGSRIEDHADVAIDAAVA